MGVIKNFINRYFEYHIRDQRGRFTPGGFLLEEVFEFLGFFYFLYG